MSAQTEKHALERLRALLDELDARLISDLNLRADLSRQVGALKAQNASAIFRPDREAALLDRALKLSEQAGASLPDQHLLAVYREILSSSRALQGELSVACQGPQGSGAQWAARQYFGSSQQLTLLPDLAAVFAAVQDRVCDLGLLPLDNEHHLHLFNNYTVFIQAECYARDSGTNPEQWTRFLVIGAQTLPGNGLRKSSIIFNLAEQPDALDKLQNLLSSRQIKLTWLESTAQTGLIFADLDCDLSSPEQQPLLRQLEQTCASLRFLGAYVPGSQAHAGC